jgi:hypothetical protein
MGTPLRSRIGRPVLVGFVIAALAGAGMASAGSKAAGVGGSQSGTPVLATGVAAVANGLVTATATPNLQHIGDRAPAVEVATAPVDGAGNFVLRADPNAGQMASVVAKAIADNNGWVNLDLTEIGADGKTTIQSISRRFVNGSGQVVSAAALQKAGPAASGLGHWAGEEGAGGSATVPAENVVVTQPSPAAAQVAATSIAAATSSGSLMQRQATVTSCFETSQLYSQGNVDTVVGELHTANDTSAYFRYGQTSDSSIDVGIKYVGGSWGVSGSVHIGNSNGAAVQWNEGTQFGYKLRSGFLYKEYYYSGCVNYYETKAASWSLIPDGAETPQSKDYNHNLDNNCKNSSWPSNFGPNTSFTRSTNSFVHFDIGFSAFGFDAGAQSGASTYALAHWKFGPNTNHYLCGNDNSISTAHRIYAGFG